MITLLLIRHGIAEDPRRGLPDAERALTVEGWERTRAAMRGLVRRGYLPTRGIASPYRRAVETLTCLREATPKGFPVGYWEGLVPSGSPEAVEDWLRAQLAEAEDFSVLALVSHQPLCSELLHHLTGHLLDFKKAACAVIHFDGALFELAGTFSPSELRGEG